jgi:hypothetical protein
MTEQAQSSWREIPDLDQLERLEHFEELLLTLPQKPHHYCLEPVDLLQSTVEAMSQAALPALLLRAMMALDGGDAARALLLADLLARRNPAHPTLRVFHGLEDSATPLIKRAGTLTALLEEMALEGRWPVGRSLDDLRAALGLNCFNIGRKNLAEQLFGAVRWEHVKRPVYYLNAFSLLYWGGLALTANRMIKGLVRNRHPSLVRDRLTSPQLGVACAYSGLHTKARELLVPLLKRYLSTPSALFLIFDGLVAAKAVRTLRTFLQSPGVLAQLRENLDQQQRLRLCSLLFNVNLRAEATQELKIVATVKNGLTTSDLPAVVFGLVHARLDNLAHTNLTNSFGKPCNVVNTEVDALAMGEALLHAGHIEDARILINQLSTIRHRNDPLLSQLAALHEQLSQPDRMRALLPHPRDTGASLSSVGLRFLYPLHLYEGTLEDGLATALANYETHKFDQVFLHTMLNFLYWLGDTAQAECLVNAESFQGVGAIAIPHLYWRKNLLLLQGRLADAADIFDHLLALVSQFFIDISNRQTFIVHFLEYALLLRQMGLHKRALAVAQAGVSRHRAFNNPCLPLVRLLTRELKSLSPTPAEAAQAEHLADILCAPRTFCQPLLYLQAASMNAALGQGEGVRRILTKKMPCAIFLNPAGRTALAGSSPKTPADVRDCLQKAFFPHLTGTYWNELLDSFMV